MRRPFASVAIRRDAISPEVRARFIEKIAYGGEWSCWEWTGSRTQQGYGRFRLHGAATTAQRAAYAIFIGDLEAGLTVDHLCNNRGCVNPRHLQAVPHRVNVLRSDGVTARHARRTHCVAGHELVMYVSPNHTQRYCPECRRQQKRDWARKRRGSAPARYRV